MKAVVTTGNGGYERLVFQDVALPVLLPGEVLLQVLAAGINNTDINTRVGWYGSMAAVPASVAQASASTSAPEGWNGATPFPLIQGADCCGRVVALAPDVTPQASTLAVGDRVLVSTVGQNWDSTVQVVGFASNPRPCMPTVWWGLDRQYWQEWRGGQLVEGRERIILTEFVMGAGMTGDWTFPYSIPLDVQGIDLGYIVADTGWVDESAGVVGTWPLYPVPGTYEIGRWWTVRGVFENTDDLGAISAWLATKLPPTLTVRHGERDYPYRFAGAEHIYTDPAREILPYYLPEWDLIE